VIHAQGARIRVQEAPGYAHKQQAYKRDSRLIGVLFPKRVILFPNPAMMLRPSGRNDVSNKVILND
jgi:hypothetical protein